MKEISNRQYKLLVDKLPRVLLLARGCGTVLTLRQQEDIRQLTLLYKKLQKKLSYQQQLNRMTK